MKTIKSFLFTVVVMNIFILLSVCVYANEADASFTAQSLKISDTEELNYWLFTPRNHSENMPLIIYLHGGSGKGDDINMLTESGFCKWVSEGLFDDTPAYIIFPQVSSKYNSWGSASVKRNLKQLIDFTISEFSIDTDRISLTGHSMDGTGTFTIGAAYNDLFSCIAPMSGSIDTTEANLTALADVPVWAFVGSEDKIIPPEASAEFINALNNNGGNGKITIFDGATHFDIPELAYLDKDLDVVGWLIGHSKRNENQNKILSVKNGVVSVNIAQADTYTLIYADYDEHGICKNIKLVTKALDSGENLVEVPADAELGNNDKIMLWTSLEKLCPVCECYIIQ